MKRIFFSLLLVLVFATIVHAAPQPTLSIDFENGVNGTGADGQIISCRVEGKSEIVNGKFGQAFKSGPSSGYLHFPTANVLSPKAGTVEMWVCPVGWSGDEKKFHVFFDARGDGALYLYKFWTKGLMMLSTPDIKAGPFMTAEADVKDWQPGQWHYIAGTWSETRQSLYVDGKHIADARKPALPTRLDAEFMIGDSPWPENSTVGPRTSSSLIDRVRIYDQVLSDEAIAAHFTGNYQKSTSLSNKTARLSKMVVVSSHEWPGNRLGLEDKVLPPWTSPPARWSMIATRWMAVLGWLPSKPHA